MCRIAEILLMMGVPSDDVGEHASFYYLRFSQMRCDPNAMNDEVLRLHIETIKAMFDAHSRQPYEEEDNE